VTDGASARRRVQELLAAGDDVHLPALTREELFALGDAPALVHAGDQQWWDALGPAERELVAATAQRSLIARNLLVAHPERDAFVPAPDVGVVLAARQAPSWLLVLREPQTDPNVWLVLHGIAVDPAPEAALVAARVEGVYAHRLLALDAALATAADWLLRPPAPGAAPVGRTVEAITPRRPGQAEVGDRRSIVLAGPDGARVCDLDAAGERGEPAPVDPAGLRDRLRAALGRTAG
jgi:hypothetical protein